MTFLDLFGEFVFWIGSKIKWQNCSQSNELSLIHALHVKWTIESLLPLVFIGSFCIVFVVVSCWFECGTRCFHIIGAYDLISHLKIRFLLLFKSLMWSHFFIYPEWVCVCQWQLTNQLKNAQQACTKYNLINVNELIDFFHPMCSAINWKSGGTEKKQQGDNTEYLPHRLYCFIYHIVCVYVFI